MLTFSVLPFQGRRACEALRYGQRRETHAWLATSMNIHSPSRPSTNELFRKYTLLSHFSHLSANRYIAAQHTKWTRCRSASPSVHTSIDQRPPPISTRSILTRGRRHQVLLAESLAEAEVS